MSVRNLAYSSQHIATTAWDLTRIEPREATTEDQRIKALQACHRNAQDTDELLMFVDMLGLREQ